MIHTETKEQRRFLYMVGVVFAVTSALTLLIGAVTFVALSAPSPPTFSYSVTNERLTVCADDMLLRVPVSGTSTGNVGSVTITQDITHPNGVSIRPSASVFEPIERPLGKARPSFDFEFVQVIDLTAFELSTGEYTYHRVARIHASGAVGYAVDFVVSVCNE